MKYKTATPEDMKNAGKQIASSLKGGDVVLLYGELGAGKTTFTQGLSEKLGVKETTTSPTFTLMNVYDIKPQKSRAKPRDIKTLVHIDTYRLKDQEDLIDTGITDYLGKKDTLCVIEWPDKIEDLLKNKKTIKISIEHTNGDTRRIKIT